MGAHSALRGITSAVQVGGVPIMVEWPSGYELNAPRMYRSAETVVVQFPRSRLLDNTLGARLKTQFPVSPSSRNNCRSLGKVYEECKAVEPIKVTPVQRPTVIE